MDENANVNPTPSIDETDVLDTRKMTPDQIRHLPGNTFSMSDGTEYKVRFDGAWVKTVEGKNNRQRYGTRSVTKLSQELK